MINSVGLKLHGFAELNKRMENLSREAATKAGQSANRAGAVVLRKAVEAEAPSSDVAEGAKRTRHNKGGTTREETHYKIKNHVKVRKTRNSSSTKVQNSVYISKAYHAFYVEFGSVHNTPNPFFTVAIQTSQQDIIDAMRKSLERQLIRKGV